MTTNGAPPLERRYGVASSADVSGRLPTSRAPGVSAVLPRGLVLAAAAFAMIGGAVTLIGWAADLQRLTDWKSDGISMFPNAALCALLSGLALLLDPVSGERWRSVARWVAGVVVAIAGLTLLQHGTGITLGIDTLLFERPRGQTAAAAPMRMGLPASISFAMIGAALVCLGFGPRARGAGVGLGVAALAIAMLSLTGHFYGVRAMYTIPTLTSIAMQTASMIAALALGVVASATDREPVRTLLERSAAGMLARRALPLVIVLALGLGWLRVFIQEQGPVDTAFGTALATVVESVLLVGLLWSAVATIRAHEQALRASDAAVRHQAAQLRAFLDTAAIALHRVGPDGTILWVNDAELAMLGYARDEYVGHHIAEFHLDRRVISEFLARLHRGEALVDFPAQMRCKDGSIKSVVIDSSVLWDDGRFVHTQCFTRDVSERRKVEEIQARLAAIVETSDDAIVSKTLQGIITSWNAGAERIFGYAAAEVVGKPIDILIPPDRRDEEREILARLRRGERIEHYETVRRAKDGHPIDISLTVSPVRDQSGRIIGASKIARDITGRKRADAEREEAARRKDEFIAILAHELRNPLAPVRNAAIYLKRKGAANPDLQRPVEMIERQVAQMARLIDDLLDAARISRGVLALRRERVAWSEIVESALDTCRDEVESKGHTLRTIVPPGRIELEVDRERLVQVLCNLIGNAVKYTPAGGQIEISGAAVTGGIMEISIKDNGSGIPPDRLTDIFDLFARVDQSLERQGGLGIGLTLVRQLVELHGGTIEARSEGIGRGSEFVVKLPIVATTAPAMAATDRDHRTAATPLRILVADDNSDTAESLALLLEIAGHDVRAVFDGEAAITAIEEVRPQVALLDIGMPKANGYEVAKRVRAHAWGDQIYLVALTGWGQDADKRSAYAAGFDAHLVKPVAPETLDRLLASIGTRAVSP